MSGTIDLTRKLLEMELRRELEQVTFPELDEEELDSYQVDRLVAQLLPFIENQIRLAKEGQR